MDQIFSVDNITTLLMLVLLQAVLGFDKLLYISIESKRVPQDSRAYVRRLGIGIAILLRLVMLFIVGILMVSEGGHLAHLTLFGYLVEPMAGSTFYFVLAVPVVVDIVQSRYQKKLLAQKALEKEGLGSITKA